MGILVGGRNRCIDMAARCRARVWAFSPKTLPRKGKHTKGVSPVGDGVSSLDLKARGFPRHISYEHKVLASLHRFPYYHSRYAARGGRAQPARSGLPRPSGAIARSGQESTARAHSLDAKYDRGPDARARVV